jgi:hypothetical protein
MSKSFVRFRLLQSFKQILKLMHILKMKLQKICLEVPGGYEFLGLHKVNKGFKFLLSS